MARRENKHGFLSRFLTGLFALVVTVALLAAYLSVFVNPEKAWYFSIFGLLYPLLVLLGLVLLPFALSRRSSVTSLLILLLLPSLFLARRYVQRAPGDVPGEGSMKVVTYNVGLFAHDRDGGDDGAARLQVADSVAAFLRGTDADLICLQEFYLPNAVDIQAWLQARFPGYHAEYYLLTGSRGHAGNVILSRYPVLYKGKIEFERSTNMALYTDLDLDTTVVRVYNCHLESYNITTDGMLRSLAGDEEVVEKTGRKLRRSIERRPAQVRAVLASIRESPVRTLVLGDFNDTPLSYTYQRLKAGHGDTFLDAGKGFCATYTQFRPFLRIDYILPPKDLKAVTHEVRKVRYSDHYPVIATFL